MKLKKFLLATFAIIGIGILTGCGNNQRSASSKDITMWVHFSKDDPEGKALAANIKHFNKTNKQGYKATVQYIPRSGSGGGYEDKINAALNSGTLPDVITLDAPNTAAYAKSKIIKPIGKYIDNKDDILDSVIKQGTYQGKLYSLGYSESSVGIYYNKKMFEKAGITDIATLDNPWTYSEFEAACQKLKQTFGDKSAFNMNLNDHSEWALYAFAPFLWSAGGSITNDSGTKAMGYLNSKASQEGFQFIRDLVKKEYTPISPKDKGFQTGKYAMQLSGTWTVQELDTQYKNLDYGVMPYPVSDKTHKLVSPTGAWQYAMTASAVNKKAAGALINFLMSKDAMYKSNMATTGLPARKSVAKMMEPKLSEPMKMLLKQNQETGKTRPVLVNYPQVTRTFAETITDVTYYDKNPNLKKLLKKQAKVIQGYLDESAIY